MPAEQAKTNQVVRIVRAHRGLLTICVAGSLFLTIIGAFDTEDVPFGIRLVFWSAIMFAAGVIFIPIETALGARFDWPRTSALRIAVLVGLWALPLTGAVWLAYRFILGRDWGVGVLPQILPGVIVVCAVAAAIDAATAARVIEPPQLEKEDPEEKFLQRLPLRLRHSQLYALEAEDHYLRVHTSSGSDLILMRLSDALAELEGADGAQTHRSWWVARRAAVDVRMEGRRAILILKDGSEVPVSRSQVADLRKAGWW